MQYLTREVSREDKKARVIFDQLKETQCPQCKWPFLTKNTDKDGNVTLICVNNECGYKSQ